MPNNCLPSRSIPINTRSTVELLLILLLFFRKDFNDVALASANPHREEKDLIHVVETFGLIPLVHLCLGGPPWAANQVLAGLRSPASSCER